MEQKELNQKLNALDTEKLDKIEHLNKRLIEWQHGLREVDEEIARIRGKDTVHDLEYDQNDGF